MAHSIVRRCPVVSGLLLAGCLVGLVSTSATASSSQAKPPTTKKVVPVAATNTVPSNAPPPVELDDGDGVDRDDNNGAFKAVPGWSCPVPGSTFRNDWGDPRSGGRTHEGTDLFAPIGTPILAPVSGTVRAHTTSGRAGIAFYLDGVDGVEYFGAHLNAITKTGAVLGGQQIGEVGDTGNAKGGASHLHFEIHPTKKSKTNPYFTLAAGCATVAKVK